jgi:choline dehydrogenase
MDRAGDAHDVVVVGAGAAGCVVARRLADRGLDVLVLEAGPAVPRPVPPDWLDGWRLPTLPDWAYVSEPAAGGESTTVRRGRLVGGTSWLTRFAVRGSPADFDAWAVGGLRGWAFHEVLPVFREIETDAEFGDQPWHGNTGRIPITRYPGLPRTVVHEAGLAAFDAVGIPAVEDHNRPGAVGFGPMPMSSHDGRRVTTADAYLGDRAATGRPELRADVLVAGVVLQGHRAVGVRLLDGTWIPAAHVVLSAGTYGSPAILMRSGVGPADHLTDIGIDVVHDLPGVGSNLADHPGVDLDTGWVGPGVRGPLLHSIATLRSSLADPDGPPDLMFWITDPDGEDGGFYLDPILLKPESRGTVRLRSANPIAAPVITLPGIRAERDLERLIEGFLLGLQLAAQPAIRRLTSGPVPSEPASRADLERRIQEHAYSLPHVVGTCAMGPSVEDGAVVDADGRVHGLGSLSVIDASVIPDAPSGFPHLITTMLAERLSERLVGLL